MKKAVAIVCFLLFACSCLTGCEYWHDENGESHFMLFGERGAMRDGKPLTEEEISSLNEEEANSPRNPANDDENQSSACLPNDEIEGATLKKGWTSDDNSILKGTYVSIPSETELCAITAKENKEVVFHLKAVLKSGEYEVVLIHPDQSETVLYDTHSDTKKEKVTLKEGASSIWMRCDSAVFESIDLSIDGLDASDF